MERAEGHKRSEALMRSADRRMYWVGQVERWRGSGLTQKAYCAREGISLDRFGSWKRRLDRKEHKHTGSMVAVPARIVSAALGVRNPTLRLEVDQRYRVEISDTFSPVTLEAVLRVLDRL